MRMINPQHPNEVFSNMLVPSATRIPSKLLDTTNASTMPQIRFGMKKTVRNMVVPAMFCVSA